MSFGDGQGFVDVMMGTVDVLEYASLQAAGGRVVFFLGCVVMGLVQEIASLMQVAGFEWGSGFYINPTPPEEAARFLREIET